MDIAPRAPRGHRPSSPRLCGFYRVIQGVGLARSIFAPYFVPGSVVRSSALISRICARTALRVSTFSRVQTPCLKLPLRSPCGPPDPLAPPCIRHRARRLLPVYRGDQLGSALRTAGLWPDSRAAGRCRPDAWGRFAATPLSIVGWIYDPDHSLRPGMYVDVPDFDRLLVAAPITVEGLDHLILKPKQLDGVTAVYVDVVFGHVAMALSKKS
jgi:hypothetical protein